MSLVMVKQMVPCSNGCSMSGKHLGSIRFADFELHLAGHYSAALCLNCAKDAERIWFEAGGSVYRRSQLRSRWHGAHGE